ncbi:GxxExxY protein [Coleofasciculus sp. FACHB-64]|uniref:GxxExxY protein n=1 Tax=Cyanophyceae TaxID=3028117 RepID=UPI0016888DBE|nr:MULTISPECIES: GxxExxY protein [unclassified Coleofasciculus]MBD1839840.1 GxxExxY protein [Coleofasciculus sp. FACHB-501]MBD1892642.1 GxxExxY protein [Coleofasciculus sp. FACHB-SPT9]MBD1898280.1 GxxExxY protein [Coleofasciculus sp. FACHB-129]MBD1900079.1 GxxExxY protein [Coleofasciculus sp. FACHB-125]MBD2044575.1 GxxExxY protein [Coleofasciculus sp. FACHB-64]
MRTNRQDAKDAKRREPSEEVDKLAYAVIGAAMEVHRVLGPGFLESVYQEALEVEFRLRGIFSKPQKTLAVTYKGHQVGEGRLDFLVGDVLIVELKAVQNLDPIHQAQVLSYLKMTNYPLALLINFNVSLLKDGIRRIVLSS